MGEVELRKLAVEEFEHSHAPQISVNFEWHTKHNRNQNSSQTFRKHPNRIISKNIMEMLFRYLLTIVLTDFFEYIVHSRKILCILIGHFQGVCMESIVEKRQS